MKTALVYYSLDGNCAFAAEQIKKQLDAELIRLHTLDEKKRSFIGKLFWGCGMVFRGKKPKLKPWTFDPQRYELIIIGMPVWASSPAPPILSFLSEAGINGKKIALFFCHGGGMGNAPEKLKPYLNGNEIIAEADFKYLIKNREELKDKIADWVKGF